MRLVTWNVNSIKARLPRVLELLEVHRPDVVCLQECKATVETFPHLAFAEAGYACADHSAGRWAGVAILAPESTPPEDVRRGLPGESSPEEARWLEATVAGVRVASVYVPNGRAVGTPPFADKLMFLEAMADRVAGLDDAAIVAGDMNVCPTDRDVYDPAAFAGATHVTEAERDRLAAVIDAGLVDVYRHLHPDEIGFTWWDYRAGHFHKGLGLRIDLVLASPALAEVATACGIDRDFRKGSKPSDHAPLITDF